MVFCSVSYVDVNTYCTCLKGEESLEHRPVNMEIAIFLDEVKTKEYRAVYKTNKGVLRYLINLLNGVSAIDEFFILSTHFSMIKIIPF